MLPGIYLVILSGCVFCASVFLVLLLVFSGSLWDEEDDL